jgi:hypothetical protein
MITGSADAVGTPAVASVAAAREKRDARVRWRRVARTHVMGPMRLQQQHHELNGSGSPGLGSANPRSGAFSRATERVRFDLVPRDYDPLRRPLGDERESVTA